jgi:eukaryotic-like serine/threonine-protein kinase
MATGRPAFAGTTSALIFDALLLKAPTPPSRVNPDLSPDLDRIISKALEKDREVRSHTAGNLRADLKLLKRDSDSGRATTVQTVVEAAAMAAQPRPWWRTRAAFWISATPLLLILGALVYWLIERGKPIESLAVLPFANACADPNAEYLSDDVAGTIEIL